MHYPSYSFDQTADATQFFFESIGSKGIIQKTVIFTQTSNVSIYNLALCDVDLATNFLDDLSVSNNGDMAKIIATVVQILYIYLTRYPDRSIIFAGNTPARNRLYRIAINQTYSELDKMFSLLGFRNGGWEDFTPDQPYELYLITTELSAIFRS